MINYKINISLLVCVELNKDSSQVQKVIKANVDPELLNTSDKWALMDEVIAYYKAVNLEYLRGLIIVIHKCLDGKSSNNIYYNKRRDIMKESLQQTEEIVNIIILYLN